MPSAERVRSRAGGRSGLPERRAEGASDSGRAAVRGGDVHPRVDRADRPASGSSRLRFRGLLLHRPHERVFRRGPHGRHRPLYAADRGRAERRRVRSELVPLRPGSRGRGGVRAALCRREVQHRRRKAQPRPQICRRGAGAAERGGRGAADSRKAQQGFAHGVSAHSPLRRGRHAAPVPVHPAIPEGEQAVRRAAQPQRAQGVRNGAEESGGELRRSGRHPADAAHGGKAVGEPPCAAGASKRGGRGRPAGADGGGRRGDRLRKGRKAAEVRARAAEEKRGDCAARRGAEGAGRAVSPHARLSWRMP